MKTKNVLQLVILICMFVSNSAFANDISVSNFSLTGQNSTNHYAMVKFDINWQNSWRTTSVPYNWDAAWVFVKYRIGTGAWQHAWLNNAGHINPSGSTITTGLLNPASPFNATANPGLGAFIYRDANGTGTFSKTGVQLRWNYGANGVSDNETLDIQVFAIEMVYVPQGSFSIGSGGTESGAFYKYPSTANPFLISSEGQITVGTGVDNLYYSVVSGDGYSGDRAGPIPAAFPKGYNAFYCMKYEISQKGYVDFLNSLTSTQASNRYPNENGNYRYAISVSGGVYSTANPYVACNYLGWTDLSAYLDWSGLRPMTELEYEKSCRGTTAPVANEYAWGTTGIASSQYTLSNSSAINENIAANFSASAGNSAYILTTGAGSIVSGPVRVGIFSGNILNTGRVTGGAAYYGIMEMCGNVWERPVTAGNPEGRQFTGTNGNGMLDVTGNADVLTWPITSTGAGFRGGNWHVSETYMPVSDRFYGAGQADNRYLSFGGRGVRSLP